MSDEYDFLFKSIVVGDGGVGKTALTLRFSKGFFTEDYKMTIGVDFHVKTINIDTPDSGLLRCKLQIWDTGGQERFSSIRPMYYRGSLGALLIFDLTNYESFEHLPMWIEEVRANVKNDIPLLLVGNKSDLPRMVSLEEINNFTRDFNLYYTETSAKTGEGVGDCFSILAFLMVGTPIPQHLIEEGAIAFPGQIPVGAAAGTTATPVSLPELEPELEFELPPEPEPISMPAFEPEPEPEFEFEAPPVPEPASVSKIEIEPVFEFEAPPVPEPASSSIIEPEPEFEFEALPVPETVSSTPDPFADNPFMTPAPKFDKVPAPATTTLERSIEPSSDFDFDFKTPDEIISESLDEEDIEPIPPVPEPKPKIPVPEPEPEPEVFSPIPEPKKITPVPLASEIAEYKPKAVPFSSNVPVPAPAPEGFGIPAMKKPTETSGPAPFLISGKNKPAESLTATETSPIFPIPPSSSASKSVEPAIPFTSAPETQSDSLMDYMPETIMSKKEKKKLEKQKKKEEKIRAKQEKDKKVQEAKEKFKQEQESKKLKKKDKKKKDDDEPEDDENLLEAPAPPLASKPSESSSLFQSLSQKTEPAKSSVFVPFTPGGSKKEESSKLRIIPNVADIETVPAPTPVAPVPKKEEKKKEVVICQQCGAMLSNEYMFCNKCGARL